MTAMLHGLPLPSAEDGPFTDGLHELASALSRALLDQYAQARPELRLDIAIIPPGQTRATWVGRNRVGERHEILKASGQFPPSSSLDVAWVRGNETGVPTIRTKGRS